MTYTPTRIRKTRCPITPTTRTGVQHADAVQCGHCDTLIVNGMVIGGCRVHSWVCDRCRAAVEKVMSA